MQVRMKKVASRAQQILSAVGRGFAHAFRFRKGNLLDQVLLTVLVTLCVVLVGGWLYTRIESPVAMVDQQQIAALVKQELQSLLETDYAWLVDLKSALQVPVSVIPETESKGPVISEPQEVQEDYEPSVETLSLSFERILWPLKGEVATGYGWYRHPVYQDWRFHAGIEFAATAGEQIRSVLAGRVESITPLADGFELVITHGSGWQSVYRGIREITVRVGDMVTQNQMLANTGDDGRMFFALLHEGEPINPLQYMSLY